MPVTGTDSTDFTEATLGASEFCLLADLSLTIDEEVDFVEIDEWRCGSIPASKSFDWASGSAIGTVVQLEA